MSNGSTTEVEIATVMCAFRAKHGLTQRQAAKLWGISQTMVALIEKGKRQPGSGEPPWREWMEVIGSQLGDAARAAAEAAGVIIVHARFPQADTPLPAIPQIRNPAGRDA